MKLSLGEVSHCSAPRCVFFAIVETEERDPPVDLYWCRSRRTFAIAKTFQDGKIHVLSRFSLKYISY